MIRLILCAALVAACNTNPPAPPRNLAIEFATQANKDAKCNDWGSGTVDAALCQVGPVTFWCRAGRDFEPVCKPVADARPPAVEAKQ